MAKLLINSNNKALVGSNGKAYAITNMDAVESNTFPVTVEAASDKIMKLLRYGLCEQKPVNYLATVTQTGKCEQASTPTPSSPVDIWCNNGAIKARRQSGLPLAYQMVGWLKSAGSIPITGFKTKSTQEIATVFYRERSGSSYLYSSDTATSGTTNTTAYLTSGGGNWRWDGKTATINVSAGIKITSIQNKDGVWINGTKSGSYSAPGDFVSTNDLRLSSGENTTVRIESQTIREGETVTLDLVPVQRVLDGAYGFYDKVSGNFYTNAEATFEAGDPITDPVEIYADGTAEVITDANGNTASVVKLFGVGNYADTQEVISGAVTRNVVVKVFDGTESFVDGTNGWITENVQDQLGGSYAPLCTHFVGAASVPPTGRVRVYRTSGDVGRIYFGVDKTVYTTADAFKAFLAAQYAAGTPVIVVYPLQTATTESVAGQTLVKSPLSATAEITIPNFVTTNAPVSTPDTKHPLPIWCNNGELKWNGTAVVADGTPEVLTISGKNLFDKDDVTNNRRFTDTGSLTNSDYAFVSGWISVQPNTTYTLSYVSGREDSYRRICGYSSRDTSTFTSLIAKMTTGQGGEINANVSRTFTTGATTKYIRISLFKADTSIMVEAGDTATAYEPYVTPQTASVEALLGVGTYKDTQEVVSGLIGRKLGVVIFDGTENWAKAVQGGGNNFGFYVNATGPSTTNEQNLICNIATASRNDWNVGADKIAVRSNKNFNFVNPSGYTKDSDISEWTAFLASRYAAGDPVIAIYPLATPTTEQTEAQYLETTVGKNLITDEACISNPQIYIIYKTA